jgi:hypothetical protein
VFGVPLDELMSNQSEKGFEIPSFFDKAISVVIERGLDIEGLFRLSGSAKEIESLVEMINSGIDVNYTGRDIHVVTGIIKTFCK